MAVKAKSFHVVARKRALLEGPPDRYFERLAAQIVRQFPAEPLVLVGFSLGAAAALRVAPHLGDRVERIDLVSPAAPLGLGDFLGGMAGAPVFRAALAGRLVFTLFTALQALAVRFAAAGMAASLMAKARGADRNLAADPDFIARLADSLRHSLLKERAVYREEILLYVADWSAELAKVTQPVTIRQGCDDDWTPPAMATALAMRLPGQPTVELLPGLSHFSVLQAFLEADSA